MKSGTGRQRRACAPRARTRNTNHRENVHQNQQRNSSNSPDSLSADWSLKVLARYWRRADGDQNPGLGKRGSLYTGTTRLTLFLLLLLLLFLLRAPIGCLIKGPDLLIRYRHTTVGQNRQLLREQTLASPGKSVLCPDENCACYIPVRHNTLPDGDLNLVSLCLVVVVAFNIPSFALGHLRTTVTSTSV